MRTVKEISRLTYENGLSRRQVAQSVALARASITDYLRRFEASGLTWRGRGAGRRHPGAPVVPVGLPRPGAATAGAGLGDGAPGIEAQGRDADAAVA